MSIEAASELSMEISQTPHSLTAELVESITFGTQDLQYKRLDVQSQLARFIDPVYVQALHDGQLVGVYVLDKRRLRVRGQEVSAFYRGVLAVDESWQGRGVGRRLTHSAREWMSDQSDGSPLLAYGCIDQSNTRSLALLDASAGTRGPCLSMYMMYRQWPRSVLHLLPVHDVGANEITELADAVYADCAVRDISASLLDGFVLRDDNALVISANVAITAFSISRMSQLAHWCTRLFVKPFAVARKRFDPEHFRYVSFSNVLIRPGSEHHWKGFVSSVLSAHRCHFGAVFVDSRSRSFEQLQVAAGWSRVFHSRRGSIQVVTQSFNDDGSLEQAMIHSDTPCQLWPVDA